MGTQTVATVVETRPTRTPRVARVCGGLACCLAVALPAPGADLSDQPIEAGARVSGSSPSIAAASHSAVVAVAVGREAERYQRQLSGELDESPLIIGVVNGRIHRRVVEGYRLAVDRVRARQDCRDLFAELEADGLDLLSSTVYVPPRVDRERKVCDAGAPAFTFVGGAQTRVCPGFGGLSRPAAAMTLIHEALHHAGLGEQPRDPDGLSPHQINRMVAKACGL